MAANWAASAVARCCLGPSNRFWRSSSSMADLVLEFETEFAAPFDEGAFCDAEFGGDVDEAPALGAAVDEFLTHFRCMHAAVIARVLERE